ncbi:MAG TPA: DUF4390 domain-containing protein, partial [Burkholderiaceae bacterium]
MPAALADDVDILGPRILADEEGYWLKSDYAFELNHNLEQAIKSQVPLYFTTNVEITRPRWYWTDEKVIRISQIARIKYNALTKKYWVVVSDSDRLSSEVSVPYATLDEALFALRRPSRW